MPLQPEADDVRAIDEWYQRKCDGVWEHTYGVRIETCDNPGWIVTFPDLPVHGRQLPDSLQAYCDQVGAEVSINGSEVRIYSRSLKICLSVAASLIRLPTKSNHL